MDKICLTCVNHSSTGCRAMLYAPDELFCWADAETQIKRETDIINYNIKYSRDNSGEGYRLTIRRAGANIRKLQGGA